MKYKLYLASIIAFTTLSFPALASVCTSIAGGTIASPLLWSTTSNWTGCPGRSPTTGDTVIIPSTSNVIVDTNVTVGNSGPPVYWYPYLTGSGGNGYPENQAISCVGGVSLVPGASSVYRPAQLQCVVINGALKLFLWDHGGYKTNVVPTLSAGTLADSAGLAYVAATNTSPIQLSIRSTGNVNHTGWLPGSTQVVKVSGLTGAWAGLNGTQTTTVISDDVVDGAVLSVPLNATGWGVTVTGVPAITSSSTGSGVDPGSPTWALATVLGGGTAAIQISHLTTGGGIGTLTIAPNITLTTQGDILVNGTYPDVGATIIMKRGAHLLFDNSLAGTSPLPDYGTISGSSAASLLLDASDCANATTKGSNMITHAGECWISAPGGLSGVSLNLQNVFMNVGSTSGAPAVAVGGNGQSTMGMTIYNCWFNKSGTISNMGESIAAHSGYIDIQGNAITQPLNSIPMYNSITGTVTTRKMQGNYVDGGLQLPTGSTQFYGTVSNNFIASSLWLVAGTTTLIDNIIRTEPTSVGINSYSSLAPNSDHNMIWQDIDKGINPRWIGCAAPFTAVSGWIGHFTGFPSGDPGEVGCPLSYLTLLPGANGFTGSRIESIVNTYSVTVPYNHNTSAADLYNTGVMDAGENGTNNLHPLTYKSNLMYMPPWADSQLAPGNHVWLKLSSSTANSTDVCTVTSATVSNCDYNSAYGSALIQNWNSVCGFTGASCLNQGKGYANSWSTFLPGAHDIDSVPPYFVDPARNLLEYDVAGRNIPLAPAWNSATTYTLGNTVSNVYQDRGTSNVYYNGQKFNYVCKVDTCPSGVGMEPGRTDIPSWHKYWVFGGQWQLLQDTLTYGNSAWNTDPAIWGHFTAGGGHTQCSVASPCTTMQVAMGWILAGFRPRQPLLLTAGHDGTTIGSMTGAPMCPTASIGGVVGAIGQGCSAIGQ